MNIYTVDYVAGAQSAQGVAIVIDVFRAFSVACYAFANGAERIIPVGDVGDALRLRDAIPAAVLVGERGGKKLDGFDHGNSPTEIQAADVAGKTLIHTTHAGTQGLVNASNATHVLTGAFVNASATIRYVQSITPRTVTLVRMGLQAECNSDEDDLCAEYLRCLLTGDAFDVAAIKPTLRASQFSDRFFDPQKPWAPQSDFDFCLDVDRFDFALRAQRSHDGELSLTQIPI